MKKLYEKSELAFALFWIILYCVVQSVANPINGWLGVESAAHAAFNVVFTVVLLFWITQNGLQKRYGLCKTAVPARGFLWYLPLVVLASHNLWNGVAVNFPLLDGLCYLCYMLCVGFVEEVLFRGFLFQAIAKDSRKLAVILSSVTFGLGHLLHLVDGSGVELAANLCQVVGAIAVGFLFVTIFDRGGSLLPCIITHAAIDGVSTFANETGLTVQRRMVLCLIQLVIVVGYTLILRRTLPPKGDSSTLCQAEGS